MDEDARLDDVPDGCGCTEIWEYMSERRNGDAQTGADEEEPADAEA